MGLILSLLQWLAGVVLNSSDFWKDIDLLSFENEGDVETKFVIPLLEMLGYSLPNIKSKQPVDFQEGRAKRPGRKPEADFVVYGGEPHGRATSLMVVEAKRPLEALVQARGQAESYASALRAPLIMLTNGKEVELWQLQPAGESELVFQARAGELASRRGELEVIAGIGAVTDLCSALANKRLDLIADDITRFEQHEHCRLDPRKRTIVRTLRNRSTGAITTSFTLFDACPKGAIVLGPSGYGKTTLAASLTREAIQLRWEGRRKGLAVEVFLPDLADYSGGWENYVAERAAPHLPAMTLQGLRGHIRRNGITIVADGLDRVAPGSRDSVFSALRVFVRDYPHAQVFLLSRYPDGRTYELNLPEFDLQPYSEEDFKNLLSVNNVAEPEHWGRISTMPEHLGKLVCEPLIADLVLTHLRSHATYPTHIRPLYEEWLEHLFRGFAPIEKLSLRALLSDIAVQSAAASIPFDKARELAVAQGHTVEVLNTLSDANAIVVREATIEVSHEALADYLRALEFIQSSGADFDAVVQTIDFEATSQFPRLLLAAARTPQEGLAIWRAIVKKDLYVGIDALQFTHGGGGLLPLKAQDAHTRVLSDLLDGYDTVVNAHFSELRAELASTVAGRPVNILGVTGDYNDGQAFYGFVDVRPGESRIVAHAEEDPTISYGMGLTALGYMGDGGRILGVNAVASGLADMLKCRMLLGGRVFTEEVVLGRLRHLSRNYRIGLATPYDLHDARERLLPLEAKYVGSFGHRSGQTFRISTLLREIEYLLDSGTGELRDWCDTRKLDLSADSGQKMFAAELDRFHRRLQTAYSEVIQRSFPSLIAAMSHTMQIPYRIGLEVDVSEAQTNRISMTYREMPVESMEEAGADVSFPSIKSDWLTRRATEDHHRDNQVRLASLATSRKNYVSSTGWGNFHGFVVSRWDGSGLPDETAITRDVAKWIRDDFKAIFARLPGLSKFN